MHSSPLVRRIRAATLERLEPRQLRRHERSRARQRGAIALSTTVTL
jgi:hypothetical protein